ncbi:MAG: long-chain-fatty-acid--CoA ligase FadD17 [Mycobacteriaceae bacterium]|nr:long-chain-fatty-acid--CoA ligase FadD17 [Mycobacteriaceae bacterium]
MAGSVLTLSTLCTVISWPPSRLSSASVALPDSCWRSGVSLSNPLPSSCTVAQLLTPLVDVDDQGIYFEDSFISWRNHIRYSAALAAALRARLDPDRPPHVGVLLENTPAFSAMLVAAGVYGIVPVGLNPVRRGDALARDISTADCQLVLTDSVSAAALGELDQVNVDSPEWAAELETHRDALDSLEFADAKPDDLFMLIFTSGTSGDPKAVTCHHGKVAIAGMTIAQRFGLGPQDVCYVAMPLFHSNAVLVGWAVAAACRGSLVLRRKFSASQFITDVRRYGATYANYVGRPLSYVLATPERPDDANNPLRVVYGNEGAPGDIERFAHRFGCLAVDGFGSTEGGVAISRTPDTPSTALGPLPAGLDIVDLQTGVSCPPGVIGELVNTTGPGLFAGYYRNPEADAQRMAGGIYHSGDLAYRDSAGYVYFAGRHGDWLRVDGENLGSAPIERIVLRHPEIIEVAVYPVPDPTVGDQIMAALVLAPGAVFDVDQFQAFLAEQPDLGPKQWPAFVRISTTLPRTATFKVLKRQLSAEGRQCGDPVWSVRR